MNEDVKNIIDQLTDKLSLQNKATEELKAIAEHYPYFGFPKFLLAKKVSEEDASTARKQLQQTALYFSNPFWLHYLLSKNESPSHETSVENAEEEIENEAPDADVDSSEETYVTIDKPTSIGQNEFRSDKTTSIE